MYLVFAYDSYYPDGGWNDYLGSATELDDALHIARNTERDHWQVVELGNGVVEHGHTGIFDW